MLILHEKFNCFKCIRASTLKAMCISVYMRINTHSSQDTFSKGKFFLFYFIYFKKFINQCENITMLLMVKNMMKINNDYIIQVKDYMPKTLPKPRLKRRIFVTGWGEWLRIITVETET